MPTRLEPAGRSRSWIRNRIYSVSFKRRIWFAFVLLVTLGITAAGSLAYLIAAKEIQRSALRSSQDTVNQSAQIVNERLKNIGVAIRALMFNSSFKSVLFDVQNGDRSNYYRTWTNLQSVFSQVKFNDSMIDSILIATPIGDFYPTSNTRDPAPPSTIPRCTPATRSSDTDSGRKAMPIRSSRTSRTFSRSSSKGCTTASRCRALPTSTSS
ncbi:hypothetical protein [Cohnella xylanilytica]|uniref:hypothetical protein n=1 Tax=Cohnella xylanilytica TaxID=557555 RepID=UPI001FE9389A|nr:hypothetical protein [Cohnella xylanilytica]